MDMKVLYQKIRKLINKQKKKGIDLVLFRPESLEFGNIIGKGGEGIVKLCTVHSHVPPLKAAAKVSLSSTVDAFDGQLKEVELMSLTNDTTNQSTLKLFGIAVMPNEDDDSKGHLTIITERGLMDTLKLMQYKEIPAHVKLDIFYQLATSLADIHQHRIIHRDLKPENFLVTDIQNSVSGNIEKVVVKIIDMGMAQFVAKERFYSTTIYGTDGFIAPEVLQYKDYDFQSDIYCLGISFAVLLFPQSVLKSSVLNSMFDKLCERQETPTSGADLYEKLFNPFLCNVFISDTIKHMLCKMLETRELRTITLTEIAHICKTEACSLLKSQIDSKTYPVIASSEEIQRHQHRDSTAQADAIVGNRAEYNSHTPFFHTRMTKRQKEDEDNLMEPLAKLCRW